MTGNGAACGGHLGESCGWTATNEGQGYTCQTVSYGTDCEPNGVVCPGGTGSTGSPPSGGNPGSGDAGNAPPPIDAGGSPATGIASLLTQSTFGTMFPNANPIYSYAGLVQAAASYQGFATTGDSDTQKRELAGFLANVAHETGGLVYVDEIVKGDYCSSSSDCPCADGQQYYGRGSLQLSWNFNYCSAGDALGVDLRSNPGLISTDSRLAWATGVWFWMTSTGAGNQTSHDAIVGGSFAGTIEAINGSIECNGGDPSEVQDRVQYYQQFCQLLGVDPGGNLYC